MNSVNDFTNKITLEATIEVLNLGYAIIQPFVYQVKFVNFYEFFHFTFQKEKVFKINVVLCSAVQCLSELRKHTTAVHD